MSARRQVAVPGILGGLGPLAHVELERHLIDERVRRGASGDADHPVWIVISATDVPDRTLSLQARADSCTPWLVHYGNRLAAAGADFVVVPCHTAHAFHAQVQGRLRVPWLHLVDETARHVARAHPTVRRVGVLATDGTLASGVYDRGLGTLGLRGVAPEPGSALQVSVMQAIYDRTWGIKAGGCAGDPRARAAIVGAAERLVDRGAEVVIAACTELSVALRGESRVAGVPLIDPLRILAAVTLDVAFGASSVSSVSPPSPLIGARP